MALEKKNDTNLKITVKRAKQFESGDVGFDMDVNNVTIYGCVYKEGKNGAFVSFPAKKSEKDGKYYNNVFVKIDSAALSDIEKQLSSLL